MVLACCDEDITGRSTVSLDNLIEFNIPVRGLTPDRCGRCRHFPAGTANAPPLVGASRRGVLEFAAGGARIGFRPDRSDLRP